MIAITFSGPIASGKTTAVAHAVKMLKERGYTVHNLDDDGKRPIRPTDNDVVIRTSYDTPELAFRIEAAGLPYAIIEAVCQRAVAYAKAEISNFAKPTTPPPSRREKPGTTWPTLAVSFAVTGLIVLAFYILENGAFCHVT